MTKTTAQPLAGSERWIAVCQYCEQQITTRTGDLWQHTASGRHECEHVSIPAQWQP
jgi:hypothetical protein